MRQMSQTSIKCRSLDDYEQLRSQKEKLRAMNGGKVTEASKDGTRNRPRWKENVADEGN